jgi:hypothetical protein
MRGSKGDRAVSLDGEKDDQRLYKRFECNAQSRALAGRLLLPGRLIDLSQGGYLFRPYNTVGLLPGTPVTADLCGHQMAAALVAGTAKGLHCRFPRQLTGKELAEILLMLASAGHVKIQGFRPEQVQRLAGGGKGR